MKKLTEFFKTVLIVLLSLSMVFLIAAFFLVTVVSDALYPDDFLFALRNSSGNEPQEASGENELSWAAFPHQIVFLQGSGDLYMPFSVQDYAKALADTVQLFEEALGSASEYTSGTTDEYLVTLVGKGVLYYFDYPVELSMLCAWSGNSMETEKIKISKMVLSSLDGNALLVAVDENGNVYRFETLSDAAYIEQLCMGYLKNGKIAAMMPELSVEVATPILEGAVVLPSYRSRPSLYDTDGELPRAVLEQLSINPYLVSVYRDADAIVYMEGDYRLRLHADGHISYSAPLTQDTVENTDENAAINAVETARRLAFSLWDQLSNENIMLSFSDIKIEEDGITVFFEAYMGGRFISRGDHASAAVKICGNTVTDVSIYPIKAEESANTVLLPYMQAQAAAQDGAEIQVQYILTDGVFMPVLADGREDR